MAPERTPQSPAPTHRGDKPTGTTDSRSAGAAAEESSLLFYATYGGSKLDPEVRLLAALMAGGQGQGTSGPVMQLVAEELGPKDFSTETYGDLFTLIVERWTNGEMTDPGSLNAALPDQGVSTKPLQLLLMEVLSVDVPVTRIPDLAKQVLIEWYRRQFQAAATYIQQVADEAPAHEKFRLLQDVGTYQAAADRRVRTFHHRVAAYHRTQAPETTDPSAVLRQRPTLNSAKPKEG